MASDLRARWIGGVNGAGGVVLYAIDLTNVAADTCRSGGYVDVSAYSPEGALITVDEIRQPAFGAPQMISVASGATISFEIGAYDTTDATRCGTTFGSLHLIPPKDTSSIQLATPGPHGFPPLCQGRILVDALRSGTD